MGHSGEHGPGGVRARAPSTSGCRRARGGLRQRAVVDPVLRGDHLGHDRQRDLFRRLGPYLQADRRVDAVDQLIRQALVFQTRPPLLVRRPAADRPDVASRGPHDVQQGRVVQLGVVAEDDDVGRAIDPGPPQILVSILRDDLIRVREALFVGEAAARVDHAHSEAELLGEARQRDADVDAAEDQQRRRGRVDVDEDVARLAVGRVAGAARRPAAEGRQGVFARPPIQLRVAQAALGRAVVEDEHPSADHLARGHNRGGGERLLLLDAALDGVEVAGHRALAVTGFPSAGAGTGSSGSM